MLFSLPRRPQPKPAVTLRKPSCLLATKYSEEKTPVPARSLKPTAIAGKILVSLVNPNF